MRSFASWRCSSSCLSVTELGREMGCMCRVDTKKHELKRSRRFARDTKVDSSLWSAGRCHYHSLASHHHTLASHYRSSLWSASVGRSCSMLRSPDRSCTRTSLISLGVTAAEASCLNERGVCLTWLAGCNAVCCSPSPSPLPSPSPSGACPTLVDSAFLVASGRPSSDRVALSRSERRVSAAWRQ